MEQSTSEPHFDPSFWLFGDNVTSAIDDRPSLLPSRTPSPNLIHTFVTQNIVPAALEVYDTLGAGHSEAVYQRALELELKLRGIDFETQVPVPVVYKQHRIGFVVLDLLVKEPTAQRPIIIELKSVTSSLKRFKNQFSKYQSLTPNSTVIAINFGGPEFDWNWV